jgi:hypothetical protein
VRTLAAARRAIVSVCTVVRGSRLVTIGDPARVAGGAEMSDEDEVVGLSPDEELRRRAVKRLRASHRRAELRGGSFEVRAREPAGSWLCWSVPLG